MKEIIIEKAIESLRREGLKFSLDTLAKDLKISKKTIYKYFSNKEILAKELYDEYYKKMILKTNNSIEKKELLLIYYDSFIMSADWIFNKFKLNNIKKIVDNKNNELWSSISLKIKNENINKIIIDGAFKEALRNDVDPLKIIEELIILC
ncbi:MAG: TetR/AcrR family transcriptional regulator [Anaeroplasma sp.]